MSRVIKFRAWDVLRKRMITERLQFTYDEDHCFNCMYDDRERIVEEKIVMQFTGLKDINDIEIYEGDIIKYGDKIQTIIFGCEEINDNECYQSNYSVGFHRKGKDGEIEHLDYNGERTRWYSPKHPNNFEVVGNIHENPELLECQLKNFGTQ